MGLFRRERDPVKRALGELRAALRSSKDDDFDRKRELAFGIAELGEPAVGPLCEALQDPDRDVRVYAALALSRSPSLDARIEALVVAVTSKGYPEEAVASVAAMGEEALEPLLRLLTSGPAEVRWPAKDAIGRLGPGVVERVIAALDAADPESKSLLVLALGNIGDHRAVPALVRRLEDEDDGVRSSTALSLSYFGDRAAVEPLVAALESRANTFGVRRAAARTLLKLGWTPTTEDQEVLLAVLDLDPVGGSMLGGTPNECLERVVKDGPAAVDELLAALKSNNDFVRRNVATVLGEIGDDRAKDPLVRAAAEDDDYKVRDAAKFALGKLTAAPGLELSTRVSGDKAAKPSRAERVAGRRGKCSTCEAVVELADAHEELWDWDGVDAHPYYCPKCYIQGDIYTGRLLDRRGSDFIDQYG